MQKTIAAAAAAWLLPVAALAQHPAGGWADALKSVEPGGTIPGWKQEAIDRHCAKTAPDSVLLATPFQAEAGEEGTLSRVHDGSPSSDDFVTLPEVPDTVAARVVGVDCKRPILETEPMEAGLILDVGGKLVEYSPAFGNMATAGAGDDYFPVVRVRTAAGVERLVWDPGHGILGAASAVQQARVGEWRAKGWTQAQITAVMNHEVRVGMTPEMVTEALGKPRRVNRTDDASGTFEQWVYYPSYVYIRNGHVSSIDH